MTTMISPIRIAIVEDHTEVRSSLRAVVSGTPGLVCVGDFPSCRAFLKVERAIDPEVVLLDLEVPGMSGIECARELKASARSVEILVHTVHDDPDWVFPALSAGASGYLLKPVEPAALVAAIRELHMGGAPMSGLVARRVLAKFRETQAQRSELDELTPRELDVLEALSHGLRYQEIATQLTVDKSTIATHLHHIYRKLHVRNATAAAARYLECRRTRRCAADSDEC